MDSDWEVFIAKDDRHRCPDGYHRNPETGQCVDANGNVYEEQQPDTPEQTEPTEEEQTEEPTEENPDEEPTDESDTEEDIEEDNPEDAPTESKPKKSYIESINERSAKLRDWVSKNFGSFEKLTPSTKRSKVVWYTAVAMPILAVAKALFGSTEVFKKIVEKREQKKQLDQNIQTTLNGFNKGLDEVAKALGIDNKEIKGHKWTEADVTNMNKALDKRLGELLESKAIKKLQADRKAGLDPKETGSIYSAEYGELRAIMTVMKESNKNLDVYYKGCVDRQIKNIQENRETKRIAEERMKQLRAMRVKGNADANTLRHTYDKQNGYKLRTRE